jgi:putative ribosome biogenesis GTPase RsgA
MSRAEAYLAEQFGRQYQGSGVETFMEALDGPYTKMYRESTHSGRIIPILQSSGVGKSRLVEELINKVR